MKKLKLHILIALLFLIASLQLKAQYVNIPDTFFADWLIDNYPNCMNGNQMDTTCADIINTTTLLISNLNSSVINQNISLEGIQYFDSLVIFKCYSNDINYIPSLPKFLEVFHCGSNNLTTLPTLPATLKKLHCGFNNLSSLPNLPNGLEVLFCHHNLFTSLPNLPSSLLKLHCYENQLTSIPTLPTDLSLLSCTNNPNLSVLPTLPSNLDTLKCAFNNLSTLPVLPNSLIGIDCGNNNLSLLPTLPTNLRYLDCANNQLTSMPSFPDSLHTVNCFNNMIDSLPSFPNTLLSIDADNNQISVVPSLPNIMHTISFTGNNLQSLPSLNTNLLYLYCGYNNISTLPNLPNGLKYLYIDNNQLSCLPILPNSLVNIQLTNNLITCLPNYTINMPPNLQSLPLCMANDFVNNPNNCGAFSGIVGSVFSDLNNNCTFDLTEQDIVNIPIKLYDSLNVLLEQTNSLMNGLYNFSLPSGFYKVVLDTANKPFTVNCPQIGVDTNIMLTTIQPAALDINFPASCKTGIDLGVKAVIRNGFPFPGQLHEVIINAGDMSHWYGMNCAAGISGEVVVTINGPVQFASNIGTIAPQINGNVYTFNVADFGSITNTQAFILQMLTDTTAQFTDQVCVNVQITLQSNDNDSMNNNFDFCYSIFNSYDPNMKEVYPQNLEPSFNDWLTYTIHFQNTGNAPAYNIRLLDTLSILLDLSTFEVVAFSHSNMVNLKGNILNFKFSNIMLPDSTSDSEGSKGFVQYRIKPLPNLPVGTSIFNTAHIYFDYNTAIVTNTTSNLYTTSISHVNLERINLFPNPANKSLTITNKVNNLKGTINIYDVMGKLWLSKTISQPVKSAEFNNLDELTNGLYFVNITNDLGEVKSIKFVKH